MTIVNVTGYRRAAIGGVRTEDRSMDGRDGRSDDRAEEVVDVIARLMPVVTQVDPEALDVALDALVSAQRDGGNGDGHGDSDLGCRRGTGRAPRRGAVKPG
jgi:hypothetical protein